MLANWSLTNFKSFRGKTDLSLAPLTFFCGANSSGKSSVVQSILLIKQTIQYAPTTRPIALNGPLVRLGTFSEIQNSKTKKIEKKSTGDNVIGLGWEIREADSAEQIDIYQEMVRKVSVTFKFDTKGFSKEQETLEIQPSLQSTEVSATYLDPSGLNHSLDVSVRRSTSPGRKVHFNTSAFSETVNPFAYTIQNIDPETRARALLGRPEAKIVGCIPQHFFAAEVVVRYDRNKEIARQFVEQILGTRPRRISAQNVSLPAGFIRLIMDALKSGSLPDPRVEEVERILFFSAQELDVSGVDLMRRFINLPPSTRRSVQTALTPYSA